MKFEQVEAWDTVKGLSKEDLLETLFSLSRAEADAYFKIQGKTASVQKFATLAGCDRTSAQRFLKRFVDKGLAVREAEKREKGGITFHYKTRAFQDVKPDLFNKLDYWYFLTKERIKYL